MTDKNWNDKNDIQSADLHQLSPYTLYTKEY